MKKEPIYIRTLEDILAVVNEDNLSDFLQDFSMWLGIQVFIKKTGVTEDKNFGVLKWIDDDTHDMNIKLEIIP